MLSSRSGAAVTNDDAAQPSQTTTRTPTSPPRSPHEIQAQSQRRSQPPRPRAPTPPPRPPPLESTHRHLRPASAMLRPSSRTEARKKSFKKSIDPDESRRKREEGMIQIRKDKRDEAIIKKRRYFNGGFCFLFLFVSPPMPRTAKEGRLYLLVGRTRKELSYDSNHT